MKRTARQIEDLTTMQETFHGENVAHLVVPGIAFLAGMVICPILLALTKNEILVASVGMLCFGVMLVAPVALHGFLLFSYRDVRQRLAADGLSIKKERRALRKQIRRILPDVYGESQISAIAFSITSNGVGSSRSTYDGLHHFKLDGERNLVHMTLTETAARF